MKSKQISEEKLIYLAELAKIDPLLVVVPKVIGVESFATLIKTFAGRTITFPTIEELKSITKKTKSLRSRLDSIIKKRGCDDLIGALFNLALTLDSKSVRKATRVRITQIILHEYFVSILKDNSIVIPIDRISSMKDSSIIELYEIFLKDLNIRANILKSIECLRETF